MSDRDREAFRLKLKAEDRNTSVRKKTETDNSRIRWCTKCDFSQTDFQILSRKSLYL